MAHNLKSMRKQFQEQGIFYTDSSLAEYMRSFLPDEVDEVYDPTCGDGALLRIFPDATEKYGQELDPEQLKIAEETIPNFHGYAGDTLTDPAFMERKFRFIMANFPFSQKWNPDGAENDPRFSVLPTIPTKGNADFAFIAHILHMMSDDGTAVVMCFPGACYRGNREQRIRQWMVENNWVDAVAHIEGGTFVDTSIPTNLLILKKKRTTTEIRFLEKDGREIVVPFDKVKEERFNLSVSTYLPFEEEKEEIDPIALEMECRAKLVRKLDGELLMSAFVGKTEGLDLNPFLDELQAVIDKYRNGEVSIVGFEKE